jgi:hypothetical protein
MGTRAQIDVRHGKKVSRIYTQFDGFPHNILPAIREAASAGHSKPSSVASVARAIMKQWAVSGGGQMQKLTEDCDDVSYRYILDISSKPWRVRCLAADEMVTGAAVR